MNLTGNATCGHNCTMTTNDLTSGPTNDTLPEEFVSSTAANVVLTVVISVVAAVGSFGNAMVVFIVFRYKDMHTVINYSFANLALTDLTLLLLDAVPTAADTVGINLSARLGCNIPIYLQFVSGEVTSLTLAFLSYDRYRLIVHPIKTFNRRKPRALLKIFLCIWLASFVLQIPAVLVAGLTPEGACAEYTAPWGQEYFFSYIMASLYCIPLGVIVLCYVKMGRKMLTSGPPSNISPHRRRRSVNIILMVIVLYALCWAPIHSVHLWMAIDPEVTPSSPLYTELHAAANILIFLNSSVNPFVYALTGPSFRSHIKMMAMSSARRQPKLPLPKPKGDRRQSAYSVKLPQRKLSNCICPSERPSPILPDSGCSTWL